MMMRALIAIFLGLISVSPAFGWTHGSGVDPMTDKRHAFVAATSRSGSMILLFKCWRGDGLQLGLATSERFDSAASYKSSVRVNFRVDQGSVFEFSMRPVGLEGRLTLAITSGDDPGILKLFRLARDGKQRIAMSIGASNQEFPLSGSKKGIAAMLDVCDLPDAADASTLATPGASAIVPGSCGELDKAAAMIVAATTRCGYVETVSGATIRKLAPGIPECAAAHARQFDLLVQQLRVSSGVSERSASETWCRSLIWDHTTQVQASGIKPFFERR